MALLLDILRTEQKYLLTIEEADRLISLLSAVMKPDKHNSKGGYLVRSLYFDTQYDKDFYEKLDGYECRRKIRLRVYSPEAETAKLELKEKQGKMQRKRSLTLPREEAESLCQGDYSILMKQNTPFAEELYGRMKQFAYQPKCLIEYKREAFTAPVNDTRVTLDRDIRSNINCRDIFSTRSALYPVEPLNNVTMEVKFNHFLLSYVKDLVSLPSRMQISASKYGICRNQILRKDS